MEHSIDFEENNTENHNSTKKLQMLSTRVWNSIFPVAFVYTIFFGRDPTNPSRILTYTNFSTPFLSVESTAPALLLIFHTARICIEATRKKHAQAFDWRVFKRSRVYLSCKMNASIENGKQTTERHSNKKRSYISLSQLRFLKLHIRSQCELWCVWDSFKSTFGTIGSK